MAGFTGEQINKCVKQGIIGILNLTPGCFFLFVFFSSIFKNYILKCALMYFTLCEKRSGSVFRVVCMFTHVPSMTCVWPVFLHMLLSSRGISRVIVMLGRDWCLPIRSGEARDLTFYNLTSMNVVNTVDLHCHVSTLWKLHREAEAPGIDVAWDCFGWGWKDDNSHKWLSKIKLCVYLCVCACRSVS